VSVDSENQQQFKKLLIAIKVNLKRTGILLAICDDINQRIRITKEYEAKLKEAGLDPKRVWIDTEESSLYHILSKLPHESDNLVVTVLGANELRSIPLKGDKSQQDEFFFSLQWTRESLLEFQCPIILWLTESMATKLAQQSPDFWSWRAGLFEFQSTTEYSDSIDDLETTNSITEYQEIVSKLEHQNSRSPLLISFYNKIGEDYQNNGDLEQSLKYYRLAFELAEDNQDKQGKELSLENLRKIRKSIDKNHLVDNLKLSHETHLQRLPVVESYGPWYRTTEVKIPTSLYFSKRYSRFSSDDLGVIHVASDPHAMFIETWHMSDLSFVTIQEIKRKNMWTIEANCPLVFADCTGNIYGSTGQDILSFYGRDYEAASQLAKTIWSHPMNVHGIKYRSRYDLNRFVYVLFDRAARYLSEKNLGNLVDNHPRLLEDILKEYNLSVLTDNPTINIDGCQIFHAIGEDKY
jgi:tetratricopeptide (TPR) repeat protein